VVVELVEDWLKCLIHIEEVDQHARLGIGLARDPELDPEGMTVKPKALVVFRHSREPVRGFDRKFAEDLHGRAPHRRSAPIGEARPKPGGYQPISDPPERMLQTGSLPLEALGFGTGLAWEPAAAANRQPPALLLHPTARRQSTALGS
jgi:hypothetical protein